jgi:hypothetical protein
MTKRKLVWTALGLFAGLALVGTYFGVAAGDGKIVLTFGQAGLQQRIDTKLEQRSETEHKVQVSSVKLDLSDDRMALDIDADAVYHVPVTKKEVPLKVKAYTKGTLRYDGHGSFYFKADKVTLKDFTISEDHVGDKVGRVIDKWITSPKILDRKDLITLKVQEITDKGIQRAAEIYLEKRPVYTLPNTGWKFQLARVALQDVQVKDGNVIVTLSIWQGANWLITTVLSILLCAALALFLVFGGLRRP